MGWLDTPEDRRRQHVQVIAGGNIKDLDRIHERDRRRRINTILWTLFIISGLWGFFSFKTGFIDTSYYLFGFALIMLIALLVRYGFHKRIKIGRDRAQGDWESLRAVPNWVFRKMKRKHTNRVNGEHYVYKREGSRFYRRRK